MFALGSTMPKAFSSCVGYVDVLRLHYTSFMSKLGRIVCMAFHVLVGIVSSPGEKDGEIALIADSISSLVTGGMSVGFKVKG